MSESERLHSRLIQAFVDSKPIDWSAPAKRMRSPSDRARLEDLRLLASIRPRTEMRRAHGQPAARVMVATILLFAAIQTGIVVLVLAEAYFQSGITVRSDPDLVVACAFGVASLVLGSKARKDARAVFLLGWLASAGNAFARHITTNLPVPPNNIINGFLWSVLPEAFMPACLWEFALVFPRVRRFASFDRIGRAFALGAWLLGGVLFAANLTAVREPSEEGFIARLVVDSPENPHSIFWRSILVAAAPAALMILLRARRAPAAERRAVSRLAAVIAIGAAPMLFLGVAVSTVPAANNWLLTVSPNERIWLDVAVFASLAATPILATMAVFVDRPFELHAFLRPAFARTLLRGLLHALTFAPFALLASRLYDERHGSLAQIFSSPVGLSLLGYTIAGCALLTVRARLARGLDRLLSRRPMEHHQQLAEGLERIRLARGTREIAVVLERELRRGTGASAVAVMSPNRAGDFVDLGHRLDALAPESALAAVLRETVGPLDVSEESELRRLLPDPEWVGTGDVALMAPLRHRDEELAAIVALGPKRRHLPFDERDLWLIAALTTAAAAAWSEAERGTDRRAAPDGDRSGSAASEAAYECPRCGLVTSTAVLPCRCGASPVLAALPARLRDSLLVQRRLGKGGMGIVYLARDLVLDRDVALKTLPRLGAGAVQRLRGEARAMGTLNHESLATIYDVDVWRRTPVLIVEYFPRGTLAQRLARGPIPPPDAVSLGIALARALDYMHARGMLHRDIKPTNIALTATGAPKLLDFGLAVLTESAMAGGDGGNAPFCEAHQAGTAAYLPPEAFHGARPHVGYDLWALALVLMESVTGANRLADAPDLAVAAPALARVLERALDLRPERRFQTASELLAALEAILVPHGLIRPATKPE